MTSESKLLVGLIGAGIQQSLTPALQEEEARHHGVRLHYQLIDLDRMAAGAEALPELLSAARVIGFVGLNITYPCKQTVVALLDDTAPEARAIGAVNTVVFRDGKSIGYNTDGSGWCWAFQRALPGADTSHVALIGAGGAGSAIAHTALALGWKQLTIVDRESARARQLAASLNARYSGARATASEDVAATLSVATGLIHATPVGMKKLPGTPFPIELLRPKLWVAEAIYFPAETTLLRAARDFGCAVMDGGGMAVGQAAGAFELFTGLVPDTVRMQRHFQRLLAQRDGQR